MNMIDVVLVGTNNLFRQGLRRLLDPSQFLVAGEARDLAALEALLEEGLAPDLGIAELNGCHEVDLDSAASAPLTKISESWFWRTSSASRPWLVGSRPGATVTWSTSCQQKLSPFHFCSS